MYKKLFFYMVVISLMIISSLMNCECPQNIPSQNKDIQPVSDTKSQIEGKIVISAITNEALLNGYITPRGISFPPRGISFPPTMSIKAIKPEVIKNFLFYINNKQLENNKIKISGEHIDNEGNTVANYIISELDSQKDVLVSIFSPSGKLNLMAVIQDIKPKEKVKKDIDITSTAVAIIKTSEEGQRLPVTEIEKSPKLEEVVKVLKENLAKPNLLAPVTEIEEVKTKGKQVGKEIVQAVPSSVLLPTPEPLSVISHSPINSPLVIISSTPSSPTKTITKIFLLPDSPFLDIPKDTPIKLVIITRYNDNTVSLNMNVTWTSNDPSVGTIDITGRFTPKKLGSVIVTGVYEGESYTTQINVLDSNLKKIEIIPDPISISKGTTIQLEAIGYDTKNNIVIVTPDEWSIENNDIGSINYSYFTAIKSGKTKITTKVGTKTKSVDVNVSD